MFFRRSLLALILLVASVLAFPEKFEEEYDYSDPEEVEKEVESSPPVPPNFIEKSTNAVVKEGEEAVINCQTDDSDSAYTILIDKYNQSTKSFSMFAVGDTIISIHNKKRVVLVGNMLKFPNVQPDDAGIYRCKLSDLMNNITHTLEVLYVPRITVKGHKSQLVLKGSTLTLACLAKGNPEPVISWSRKDKRLPSGEEHEEGSSLTLEDVDRHVEGTYVCTASSDFGNPASAEIKVMVEYPPEIITEKGENEEKEDWKEVTAVADDDTNSNGLRHSLRHIFTDLQPASDYEVVVMVKNTEKWSDEARYNFSTRRARPTPISTDSIASPNQIFPEDLSDEPGEETVSLHTTSGGSTLHTLTISILTAFLICVFIRS